jgi:hypothetical protein
MNEVVPAQTQQKFAAQIFGPSGALIEAVATDRKSCRSADAIARIQASNCAIISGGCAKMDGRDS